MKRAYTICVAAASLLYTPVDMVYPWPPQGRRCMLYIPLATHFDFPNYLTARWVAAVREVARRGVWRSF